MKAPIPAPPEAEPDVPADAEPVPALVEAAAPRPPPPDGLPVGVPPPERDRLCDACRRVWCTEPGPGRVVIVVKPEKVLSWDHSKLGGAY